MYELFVLGELMDSNTAHGYLLHTILNGVVGPMRKISWGVLYPLIRRLEKEGFIEQVQDDKAAEGKKRKKIYQIIESGRTQFYSLMEEPINYTVDYEVHFQIKLSNFDKIKDDIKLIILHQYKDYLRFNRRHIENSKARVLNSDNIPNTEMQSILNVHDLRSIQIEVNESWVKRQIQEVKKQEKGETIDE